MQKLPISKTAFKKLIVQISKETGNAGYIREFSWRPLNPENWDGSLYSLEEAYSFFNEERPILNIHYWDRPAPGQEIESQRGVLSLGNILELIKNGYEVYTESYGSKEWPMYQKVIRVKK
jgi:hypothetical protein